MVYSLPHGKDFPPLLLSADLFQKNSFRNTTRVSNSLDLDQTRHSVWPDLGPNCLQKLSADYTRSEGDKWITYFCHSPNPLL